MPRATAEVAEFIDSPPERVWDGLTDPKKISKYFLGAKVDTDWKVGNPITWEGEFEGKQYKDKGEVLAFEPGRQLSFSHWSPLGGTEDVPENYHRVDIDLEEQNGGTKVVLRQSNLSGEITEEDRKQKTEFEKNWKTMLTGLNQVVTKES